MFDRYLYQRIKTLVAEVLPHLGVSEHMIRFEVQHRQVNPCTHEMESLSDIL